MKVFVQCDDHLSANKSLGEPAIIIQSEKIPTRFEALKEQLLPLAEICGLRNPEQNVLPVVRDITRTWGDGSLAEIPRWSGLGADASACDFSIAIRRTSTKLRVTVECQGDPPKPSSYHRASMELARHVARKYEADLTKLNLAAKSLKDLDEASPGVMWFGAEFGNDGAVWFKAYIHLWANGYAFSAATAESIMQDFQLEEQWHLIRNRLSNNDQLLFISIDLRGDAKARVKLYVRHRTTSAEDVVTNSRRLFASTDHEKIGTFARTILGSEKLPIVTSNISALEISHEQLQPANLACHLRLYPTAGFEDSEIQHRITEVLELFSLPVSSYLSALEALEAQADRNTNGLHGWISLDLGASSSRVNVYFCPRFFLHSLGPISLDPTRMWPRPTFPDVRES